MKLFRIQMWPYSAVLSIKTVCDLCVVCEYFISFFPNCVLLLLCVFIHQEFVCESFVRFIRFKQICVYTLCEWGAAILQVDDVLDWALGDSALCR